MHLMSALQSVNHGDSTWLDPQAIFEACEVVLVSGLFPRDCFGQSDWPGALGRGTCERWPIWDPLKTRWSRMQMQEIDAECAFFWQCNVNLSIAIMALIGTIPCLIDYDWYTRTASDLYKWISCNFYCSLLTFCWAVLTNPGWLLPQDLVLFSILGLQLFMSSDIYVLPVKISLIYELTKTPRPPIRFC